MFINSPGKPLDLPPCHANKRRFHWITILNDSSSQKIPPYQLHVHEGCSNLQDQTLHFNPFNALFTLSFQSSVVIFRANDKTAIRTTLIIKCTWTNLWMQDFFDGVLYFSLIVDINSMNKRLTNKLLRVRILRCKLCTI